MKNVYLIFGILFLVFYGCSEDPGIMQAPTSPSNPSEDLPDIKVLLQTCPDDDPLIDGIMNDFEIRLNGTLVENIGCIGTITDLTPEEYQMPLIILQALRVIRRMDAGALPWTEETLYDWIKNSIGGINIVDDISSGGYCCETFEGKTFIVVKNLDEANRTFKRKWIGMSSTIGLIVHEVRHLSGPGHTSCCGIDGGCDLVFDLTDISSYGTQLWLNRQWRDNKIDVGLGSFNSVELLEKNQWFQSAVSLFEGRFCQ